MTQKSHRAWVVLFGTMLMYFIIGGFFSNTINLYIEPITSDLGILRGVFTITITINSLTNAIVSTMFGTFVRKLGPRKMVFISGLSAVISLWIFAVAKSIYLFYIGSVFVGLSVAFGTTAMSSLLVNTWFAKRQGMLIGIAISCNGLGGIVGSPLVNGWIVNSGWQTALIYTSVVAAAAMILLPILIRSKPEDVGLKPLWAEDVQTANNSSNDEATAGLTLKEARHTMNFWCALATIFLIGLLLYPVLSSIAAYATDLGFGAQAGTLMSVCFIVNVIITTPLSTIFDKFGARWTMIGCMVLIIISFVLFSLENISLPLLFVASGLTGISLAMLQVPVPLLTSKVFGKKDFASIVGQINAGSIVGIAVGTPIFNFGFDILGTYRSMFMAYIPIGILVIVLIFLTTRKIKVRTD